MLLRSKTAKSQTSPDKNRVFLIQSIPTSWLLLREPGFLMSDNLEELHAQRELIQKHLNWLDTQIKDAEDTDNNHGQSPRAEQTDEKPVQVSEHVSNSTGELNKLVPAESAHDEIEEQLMEYSGSLDIQRIKAGCLIFFAAISLIFLFLLFGLPYLLD
jgi:hypothetical protein